MTTLFFSAICLCRSTSFLLHAGKPETSEAIEDTSSVRILPLTSLPSRKIFPSSKSISVSAIISEIDSLSGTMPCSRTLRATARYIAPVSIYSIPSRPARFFAAVLFPEPEGPSIAIRTGFIEPPHMISYDSTVSDESVSLRFSISFTKDRTSSKCL